MNSKRDDSFQIVIALILALTHDLFENRFPAFGIMH